MPNQLQLCPHCKGKIKKTGLGNFFCRDGCRSVIKPDDVVIRKGVAYCGERVYYIRKLLESVK